ncbi:MAG: TSUP family transporter [Hominimerdicola sp.]
MNIVTICIVSFLTGVFASLGLGGGMVLIIYLTIFAGFSQIEAQGINLVFFIPIAIISLILHTKNNLIEWKKIVPAVIAGTFSVIIFSILANNISSTFLGKIFAVFLLLSGINELIKKKTERDKITPD